MMSPHCVETLPFRKLCHPILVCALIALSTFAPIEGDVIVGRLWFTLDTIAMPALIVSHTGRGACNFWREWNRVSSEDLRDFLIGLILQLYRYRVFTMAVLQHRHLFATVGAVLDLKVNFFFCAPVFAMSIMNLI